MTEANRSACQAITRAGRPCKNRARAGEAYCHVHARLATEAGKTGPGEDRAPGASAVSSDRLTQLIAELDALVLELKTAVPDMTEDAHSPLRLLQLLRSNLGKLAPDVQLDILESLEGLTREDLIDLETWKGLAYMLGYSARFQAGQVKERMNEQLPGPLQPDSMWQFVKSNIDRMTPEMAKGFVASFEGASKEDLLDPDTWKGLWTMMQYSIRFQAEQLRERMLSEDS